MPLNIPSSIFRGITPSGARKILPLILDEFKDELLTYVNPCAGQLTVSESLVGYGVSSDKIVMSDISLYTSALGYLVDDSHSVSDLGFKVTSPKLGSVLADLPSDTDVDLAARILYSLKWVQLHGKTDFIQAQLRELEVQREKVHAQYVKALSALKESLSGARYSIRDAQEHIDATASNPAAFIWHNPPGYKGGYGKMFAPHGNFEWDTPTIPELDPSKNDEHAEMLLESPATVALFFTEGHAFQTAPAGWHKLYVSVNDKTRLRSYVLLNRPVKQSKLGSLPAKKKSIPLYQVFDDHEITPDSTIGLHPCTKEQALYYYDLFARELGMVKAECYYLFIIDGQVAGTCGFFRREWVLHRVPILYETFGLSITSTKYARIGRLLMGAITCEEFKREVESSVQKAPLVTGLKMLRTTCLTKYPEAKKNRGILKLVHRERMPNGRFYLIYDTDFHQKTYKQILLGWLEEHAKHVRSKEVA